MGSGKSATTTQQVTIPPEVLARYNAVNARAESVANTPFQPYSNNPNAFVAPLTQTQQAGIQNINNMQGQTGPYFQTAAGMTLAGSQGVNPSGLNVGQYLNPFTQYVAGSTEAALRQQQGQQLSQQQAEAIRNGAFGGDRSGLQRAALMGQQGLATAQALSPIYQQGYQQALQTAQQQQGVGLQAEQANLSRLMQGGQQLAGLGSAQQQAGLAAAQAQLGAGTAEQQTQQAGLQALYNQFLQERGYPFQIAQFLANIAMGTGALSGSTTTTTQPAPFFSDEREKTNIKPLGKGLYAYDYKDDVEAAEREGRPMGPKRVGPMAQDIERRAPGLVVDVNDYKVVDPAGKADGGAMSIAAPTAQRSGLGFGLPSFLGGGGGYGAMPAVQPGAAMPQAQGQAQVQGSPTAQPRMSAIDRLRNGDVLGGVMQGAGGLMGGAFRVMNAPPSYYQALDTTMKPWGGYSTPGKGAVQAPNYNPGVAAPRYASGGYVDEPGAYDRGGFGPGGLVSPTDLDAILKSQAQFLGPYGGQGGPYGGQQQGKPGYVPSGALPVAKLTTAGGVPQQRPSGLAEAAQTGSQLAGLAKMGTEAFGAGKKWLESGKPQSGYVGDTWASDTLAGDNWSDKPFARGGLVPHGYAMGGSMPYGGDEILQGVVDEGKNDPHSLSKPGEPPKPPKGLGSDLMDAAKLGSSLYSLGSAGASAMAAAPEALSALMAFLPFSDRRLKHNIDPVGETYDGQQIYRYDMGDGRTQLGLMAQEVAQRKPEAVGNRNGYLTLDYDRATEDAVPRAYGGLVPRHGYADGGAPPDDEWRAALQPTFKVPDEYAPIIEQASRETGIPAAIIAAKIKRESGFDPRAVGKAGEVGLAQVKPSTARDPGFGVAPVEGDLSDPRVNIPFGARYLRARGDAAGVADWNDPNEARKGLMAYNSGANAPQYARNVLALVRDDGQPAPTGAAKPEGLAGGRPTRATPGLAGPGYIEDTPRTSPFKFFTERMLKGRDIGEDTKSALTSENLWIPLLAGAGSMLASRSPYLGNAIGEGLVGGTKAYTDLAKSQQEMAESRGRTEERMANISNNAFSEVGGILRVRVKDPITGTYRMMSNAEYLALPPGKRPPIDPRVPEDIVQRFVSGAEKPGAVPASAAPASPTAPTKVEMPVAPTAPSAPASAAPKTETPAAPAPGEPPAKTSEEPRPSGVPTVVALNDADRADAFEQARQVANMSQATREDMRRQDMFGPQRRVATSAEQGKMSLMPLATTIIGLPEGQSLGTSGPFTEAIAPYISTLQNLAEAATGKKGVVIDPKVLADREEAKKLIARLEAETTTQAGQTAVEAMKRISEGLVNLSQSKTGQKQILANVLATTQRQIDKDRFFADWIAAGSTAPGGEKGTFGDYARLTSEQAARRFDQRYSQAYYAEEEKKLLGMMNTRVKNPADPSKPISVFEFVSKYGPQLDAKDLRELQKKYGPGITRYFGING